MKSFATLIDEVQDLLNDDGTDYTDAFVTTKLEHAFREVSEYQPYIVRETFEIESRTGSATSTTADKLVDSTGQFLTTDVDKVIFNDDDKAFAIVTAYDDANTLSLSKDIMVSGEDYEMFNEGCFDKKQINLEDITDWVGRKEHGVIAVEHPIGTRRNFTVDGDILTIKVDSVDDTADTDADKEVYVWFEKRHRVSQLTDLLGAVDLGAGYVVGSTSMVIDEITTDEIVAEGQLFTIAGIRGTYRVTAAVTIASSEATVSFYPGLESAATEDDVVTFVGSTLNSELEMLVAELTAARSGLAKTVNKVNVGGASTVGDFRDKLVIVLSKLERVRNRRAPRTKQTYYTD